MAYTHIFTLTDEQRAQVRSALFDSAYDYKKQLETAMESGTKWIIKQTAEKYFRAARAIELMGYTCNVPVFDEAEKTYDGSDDILANIVADMEPYNDFVEPETEGYCSCGLTVEACAAKTEEQWKEEEV